MKQQFSAYNKKQELKYIWQVAVTHALEKCKEEVQTVFTVELGKNSTVQVLLYCRLTGFTCKNFCSVPPPPPKKKKT
jgi:hypothetical protein